MTLTARQKLLVPILVLVLVFLAWQVYRTAAEGFIAAAASQPKINTNAVVATPAPTAVAFNDVAPSNSIKLSPTQADYVALVNQAQRLEMEKVIAANSQAIAEARLRTAQAEAQLANYATTAKDLNVSTVVPKVMSRYQLVYTGKFQNQWTATLRKGSELIDINVGNRLDNGATVTAINGEEVIIRKKDKETIIGFDGQQSKIVPVKKLAQLTPEQVAQMAAISDTLENTAPVSSPVATPAAPTVKSVKASTPTPAPVASTASTLASNNSAAVLTDTITTVPALPAAKVTAVKIAKAATPKISQSYSPDEQKILALNSQQFAVQLIGSYKSSAITQFITQNNLADNAMQFETRHNGRPWFALLYGQYNSISDAVNAIAQMPAGLKVYQPFVRKVDLIQREIKNQHIG